MKKIILLLLLTISCNGFANDKTIKGVWLGFGVFTNIKSKILINNEKEINLFTYYAEGNKTREDKKVIKIKQTIVVNNKFYFVIPNENDTNLLSLFILNKLDANRLLHNPTNVFKNSFNNISEIQDFIKSDTSYLPGFIYYPEADFLKFKNYRQITQITREDYIKYLNTLYLENSKLKEFLRTIKEEDKNTYMMLFLPNIISRVLADLKYNPNFTEESINKAQEKFKDDKEIMELLKKAWGF